MPRFASLFALGILVCSLQGVDAAASFRWLPELEPNVTEAGYPRVPVGGAVEFAVDHAAGTCRVTFYAPAAVESSLEKGPHPKMRLGFVPV
jgi:hypothetical protein